MRIEKRSLNWFQKTPLYKQAIYNRTKMRFHSQKAQQVTQTLAANLSNIQVGHAIGMAELAGRAAMARVTKVV